VPGQKDVIIRVRKPEPELDDDGKPIIGEDGSFVVVHEVVTPIHATIDAMQSTVQFLQAIQRHGLVLMLADGQGVQYIPAKWICDAFFEARQSVPPNIQATMQGIKAW